MLDFDVDVEWVDSRLRLARAAAAALFPLSPLLHTKREEEIFIISDHNATDADTTSFHDPTNTMIMSIDQDKRDASASLLLRACACGCKCCDLSPFLRI